jgi:hypothetical protein
VQKKVYVIVDKKGKLAKEIEGSALYVFAKKAEAVSALMPEEEESVAVMCLTDEL